MASCITSLDFGMTASGIAYILRDDGDKTSIRNDFGRINVVEYRINSLFPPKTQSRIDYKPGGKILWGEEAAYQATNISLLKLFLLDEKDIRPEFLDFPEYRRSKARIMKLRKNAIDVVADYLERLWANFEKDLTNHSYTGDSLRKYPLKLIITVPAIFPAYYRDRLLEAIRRAGILKPRPGLPKPHHEFVTEPEAAAYKAILNPDAQRELTVGDTFMVLDCGGATVDVITYECIDTKPMTVREALPGDGAFCGAAMLDAAFERLLVEKLIAMGASRAAIENDRAGLQKALSTEWEHRIKCNFNDTSGDSFRPTWLDLPDVKFTRAELRALYTPVIGDLFKVVDKQLDLLREKGLPVVKFIQMAGGFALSSQIVQSVRAEYQDRHTHVTQENSNLSWSAICRGAVLFGMLGRHLVSSRALRDALAFSHNPEYDKAIHDERDAVYDEVRDTMLTQNQLLWFFNKGDDIDVGSFRDYKLNFAFDKSDRGIKSFSEPLYMSSLAIPSVRLEDAEDYDPTFHQHGIMKFTTPVPVQKLPLEDGQYMLNYRLRIQAVAGKAVKLTAVWDCPGRPALVIGRVRMSMEADEDRERSDN